MHRNQSNQLVGDANIKKKFSLKCLGASEKKSDPTDHTRTKAEVKNFQRATY